MSYYFNAMPHFRQPNINQMMPLGQNILTPIMPPMMPITPNMPTYPSPVIGTTLPTGLPAGPATAPIPLPSVTPPGEIPAQTLEGTLYTPGYLKTQIGKKVRVEFLIGTASVTDRIGTLVGVGANYILLLLEETDDIMLGDLYAIKFVTFYR